MKNRPFFSIVIPTHNRTALMDENLYALKNQTFTDFEVIVSDNTFTEPDCKEIFNKYADERFHYLKPPHELGMVDNWEFALKHACGQYVKIVEDKQFLYLNALEMLAEVIKNNGYPDCLQHSFDFIDLRDLHGEKNACLLMRYGDTGKVWSATSEELITRILNDGVYAVRNEYGYFWGGNLLLTAVRKNVLDEIVKERGSLLTPCLNPDCGRIVLDILTHSEKIIYFHDSCGMAAYFSKKEISNGYAASRSSARAREFVMQQTDGEKLVAEYSTVPNMYAAVSNLWTADINYAIASNPKLKGKTLNKVNVLADIYRQMSELVEWNDKQKDLIAFQKALYELSEGERQEFKIKINEMMPPAAFRGMGRTATAVIGSLREFLDRGRKEDVLQSLLAFARCSNKVYCYGAGYFGNFVYNILKNNGVELEGFIVTEKPENQKTLHDKPVFRCSNIDIADNDGVILALSRDKHEAVLNMLQHKDVKRIFCDIPYEHFNSQGLLLQYL